jgi:hypothetical protein
MTEGNCIDRVTARFEYQQPFFHSNRSVATEVVRERTLHRSIGQAYFLTAFSMAPPALFRSSGIMTG